MDPRVNPYAPGAGTSPPELAGRDDVLADARLAIQRNESGRSARSSDGKPDPAQAEKR